MCLHVCTEGLAIAWIHMCVWDSMGWLGLGISVGNDENNFHYHLLQYSTFGIFILSVHHFGPDWSTVSLWLLNGLPWNLYRHSWSPEDTWLWWSLDFASSTDSRSMVSLIFFSEMSSSTGCITGCTGCVHSGSKEEAFINFPVVGLIKYYFISTKFYRYSWLLEDEPLMTFCDPLIFPLASSWGWHLWFWEKCLNNYWTLFGTHTDVPDRMNSMTSGSANFTYSIIIRLLFGEFFGLWVTTCKTNDICLAIFLANVSMPIQSTKMM